MPTTAGFLFYENQRSITISERTAESRKADQDRARAYIGVLQKEGLLNSLSRAFTEVARLR